MRGSWKAPAVICLVMISTACGVPETRPPTASVHNIHIDDDVTPTLLYVQRGDEVRWHNLRPHPVRMGLLGTTWRNLVVCQTGFTRFGQVDDLVMIPPQQYVSLCFSRVGTVRYNVWLDPKNLTGSMTPTSTIRID